MNGRGAFPFRLPVRARATKRSSPSLLQSMPCLRLALIAPVLLLATASAATSPSPPVDPLRFFVGRTESVGRVKVMFHHGYGTHSSGQGRIEPDGSLLLVQQVFDDGKPPHERRWHVRQVTQDRYTGTMTEAEGPVTIDRIGDRYRFSFRMDGRLNVEQVLTPLPGGRAATNDAKVRRLGLVVATTQGIVRKL
jgi:hypothetical protein